MHALVISQDFEISTLQIFLPTEIAKTKTTVNLRFVILKILIISSKLLRDTPAQLELR